MSWETPPVSHLTMEEHLAVTSNLTYCPFGLRMTKHLAGSRPLSCVECETPPVSHLRIKHFLANQISRGVGWVFTTSDWHLTNRRLLRDSEQIGDPRRREYTVHDEHSPSERGSDGPSYHSDPTPAPMTEEFLGEGCPA